MAEEIEGLKAKIKELEIALETERKRKGPMREKIQAMSSEVVDSNPYRLAILKRFAKWFVDAVGMKNLTQLKYLKEQPTAVITF